MEGFLGTMVEWGWKTLPAWMIRWYWKEDRLRSRVILEVRPRGDALLFCDGNPTKVELHLQIINLLPFSIEIDRASAEVDCNGRLGSDLQQLRRFKLRAFSKQDLLLTGGSGVDFEKQFRTTDRIPEATVRLYAQFECEVRKFQIDNADTAYLRPSVSNLSKELRAKFVA